jgi:hypothetical protein
MWRTVLIAGVGAGLSTSALAGEPELTRLADVAAFGHVCEAVRTEASVTFQGDEVQRGRARAEFKRRRDEVLQTPYRADIPAGGFAFGEYDYNEHRLPIDHSHPLRPAEGVELLSPLSPEEELDFQVAPDAAQSIVRARASGKLHLRMKFRLAPSAELPDPCVRLGGGRSLKVRIDPLQFELTVEGEPRALARAESPRYKDVMAELMPVAAPRVQVQKTADLSDAGLLKALEGQLLGCYKAGLVKNARLRGSLVIGLALDREGRVESARPEIDAIGNEALVGCAMERVKAQRFPKGKPRLSIPVYFQGGD